MANSVPTTSDHNDLACMRAALALARRGLGRVAPNPAVGCVITKAGRVVGRGWTRPGGRPHAETEALASAGAAARGATAYVSLEPCSHHGQTPPCADALIAAGIARCVIALEDPDPRVGGEGQARLQQAGIAVEVGLCREDAEQINAGYLLRQRQGRPLVTLKLASTIDGRIATKSGQSRWITGEAARNRGHMLRAVYDALLVGSGTAVADNPRLDVRLPGLTEYAPLRVVLDGRLRLPLTHDLVTRAKLQPTWLVTHGKSERTRLKAYQDAGVEILKVADDSDSHVDLHATLQALGKRGLTRVLVEGGGHIAAALLKQDLVDRLVWFRAPRIIGGDGVPAIAGFGLEDLDDTPRFSLDAVERVGDDLVEYYSRDA